MTTEGNAPRPTTTEGKATRPYFPRRNEWTTEYLKFSAPMPGPPLDVAVGSLHASVKEVRTSPDLAPHRA